jgi:hypothetical protein
MLPTWPAALGGFGVASVFLTSLGLPLAGAIAPRGMPALGLAPALGWAIYTVLALPVLSLVGFDTLAITMFSMSALGLAVWFRRHWAPTAVLPRWGLAVAACMAWLPAMAIMPKTSAAGILLAPPMFDHVKIAIVDAVLRLGLPVANPFYGPGAHAPLGYYYLWHFGTAVLAQGLHIGGWSAQAAMTGFTAYASLALMMGLAVWCGGGRLAVLAVCLLSLPGSMRPLLAGVLGAQMAGAIMPRASDLGGWLNQAAWVPQHLASACCVLLSALAMIRLADSLSLPCAAILALTMAAGFESSVWVGGVAFAASGMALGIYLLWPMAARRRWRFLAWCSLAAMLAAALVFPVAAAEWQAVRARGGGGLAALPYPSFGVFFPQGWRLALDWPGFWLVLLPFSFPAVAPLGFASVTIANNDLGWRAVLPGLLVLTAAAAAVLGRALAARRWGLACASLVLAACGVPDSARMLAEYMGGQRPGDAAGFAASEALWQAVRRHAGPSERVGNNPDLVGGATPWPVNIAWATLSDRPSCYAGWASVVAYGALPDHRLLALNDQFLRVFAGAARPGDVAELAWAENCAVIAVTPGDGAWQHDPFAESGVYRLAEGAQAWRIYTRVAGGGR